MLTCDKCKRGDGTIVEHSAVVTWSMGDDPKLYGTWGADMCADCKRKVLAAIERAVAEFFGEGG